LAAFRFSRSAETDLIEIGTYTLRRWSEDQAIHYIDNIETCCQQLARNPESGRACDHVRPGLRRMEHDVHVVFYRQVAGGILISRSLHQRMLPERQVIDEQERQP
jgi:toxin ParE1/3/4